MNKIRLTCPRVPRFELRCRNHCRESLVRRPCQRTRGHERPRTEFFCRSRMTGHRYNVQDWNPFHLKTSACVQTRRHCSSMDRASAYGAEGRRFDPFLCQPFCKCAFLLQFRHFSQIQLASDLGVQILIFCVYQWSGRIIGIHSESPLTVLLGYRQR